MNGKHGQDNDKDKNKDNDKDKNKDNDKYNEKDIYFFFLSVNGEKKTNGFA